MVKVEKSHVYCNIVNNQKHQWYANHRHGVFRIALLFFLRFTINNVVYYNNNNSSTEFVLNTNIFIYNETMIVNLLLNHYKIATHISDVIMAVANQNATGAMLDLSEVQTYSKQSYTFLFGKSA